jgi:hypothetical protein
MDHDDDLIELNLSKANKLSFRLDVSGTDSVPTEARLVCEDEGIEYGFPCLINGEELEVSVPCMEGKISAGNYRARLEVIVEGTRFVPVVTELTFKSPVKVQVAEQRVPMKPTQPSVSLKAKYVQKAESTPVQKPTNNVPLSDALRKIVQEAVTEARPVRPRSK